MLISRSWRMFVNPDCAQFESSLCKKDPIVLWKQHDLERCSLGQKFLQQFEKRFSPIVTLKKPVSDCPYTAPCLSGPHLAHPPNGTRYLAAIRLDRCSKPWIHIAWPKRSIDHFDPAPSPDANSSGSRYSLGRASLQSHRSRSACRCLAYAQCPRWTTRRACFVCCCRSWWSCLVAGVGYR